ncbi:Coatomer subunit gamma [Seminavis robusta]|uniref:Coatomer subunit gamma n=1 Tax=Seminavis robusta TaxID=568900 RepID=A0A9N8H2X2_9STRA|nr:Coatomer subunit gamma [Seminavis robusta]|eukprot:Sro26_g017600.1 Coatomer subunit gamma (956) ;mRNA; f:67486-70353
MGDQQEENMGMSSVLKEVQELAEKFKVEEDEQYISPYAHLEKATVLQEARIFHDPVAVRENPRKCCTVIAQLLHLQNTGQFLSGTEATEVFFGVTKLFMSDDASLRRMVYLFIKDVAETCNPDDVIIVTSCLTKDMTCDVDLYRANALRVLVRIVDAAMLGAIERYVKQAVVDSSGQVSSSALVSASHLFVSSPECAAVVRRWISETQEATSSPNEMVQFHAMQLLYQIKSHDRLGVSKLVSQFSQRNSLRSPLALVLLVRYTAKLLHDEHSEGRNTGSSISEGSPVTKAGYHFLESSLRHKSELVVYEAARAICNLPATEPQDLSPAISVLQLFLSSPKPAVRFASIRTLAMVANSHPRIVSKCNEDLEALIGDTNRSIATLAITTLLKTGSENSIDRLLKQISSFLTDIADEYKITIVRSLQKLCLTYPAKHRVLVGFLSNFLREEGGFDFKRSIVSSIVALIRTVPETTESSLLHLCEFIEDCEFTMLSTQILHLLGELGPQTTAPARYIRFIYNRVILENSAVRAAAVSALAKFAASCPSLRTSIMTLMKRSLVDEDDETRDRTSIAVSVLEEAMAKYPYVAPPEDAAAEDIPADKPVDGDTAAYLLLEPLPMSFDKLERSLKAYMAAPMAMQNPEPVTLATLPVVEDTPAEIMKAQSMDAADAEISGLGDLNGLEDKKKEIVDPAAAVYAIPELAALGRAFRSSTPVQLTESETEYVVTCIKHIFENHVVLQFTVQNTIDEQRLDNVTVLVDDSGTDVFTASGEIAATGIRCGDTKHCFTILERNTEAALTSSHFTCELRFTVVQIDPVSGEEEGDSFEEEYPLEDLEVATSDFMAKVSVPDFRKAWEAVGNANEVMEKFALQFKKMEDAVSAVIDFLGMQACDGTAALKPNAGNKPHMLHMSGVFMGNQQVLSRAQIAMQGDNGSGVVLKIAVRSDDPNISRMVADCIH